MFGMFGFPNEEWLAGAALCKAAWEKAVAELVLPPWPAEGATPEEWDAWYKAAAENPDLRSNMARVGALWEATQRASDAAYAKKRQRAEEEYAAQREKSKAQWEEAQKDRCRADAEAWLKQAKRQCLVARDFRVQLAGLEQAFKSDPDHGLAAYDYDDRTLHAITGAEQAWTTKEVFIHLQKYAEARAAAGVLGPGTKTKLHRRILEILTGDSDVFNRGSRLRKTVDSLIEWSEARELPPDAARKRPVKLYTATLREVVPAKGETK